MLKQCNIKTMQHLAVQYQTISTLNSETATIATTTSAKQLVQYERIKNQH